MAIPSPLPLLLFSYLSFFAAQAQASSASCPFVLPQDDRSYQCVAKCPHFNYAVALDWPQKGSKVCMPCHLVKKAGRGGYKCSSSCPKGTKDVPRRTSKGVPYFICAMPGEEAVLRAGSPDNGRSASSRTGSGAYVGGDPRRLKEGCAGPKRLTFGFVTDEKGRFLGYDKSTIEKAVQKGLITREEADSMQISPVSKRVGADGKYYYVDNQTDRKVIP